MSIYTVVDYQNRWRLMKWLHEKTCITMESGGDTWPIPELSAVRRDAIVKATKAGISIIFPLDQLSTRGRRLEIREFCEKIRAKFPIIVTSELKAREKPAPQASLLGMNRSHRRE